jgi:hypothetical protein
MNGIVYMHVELTITIHYTARTQHHYSLNTV